MTIHLTRDSEFTGNIEHLESIIDGLPTAVSTMDMNQKLLQATSDCNETVNMNRFRNLRLMDPEASILLEKEMARDLNALNLSAPESYMPRAVSEALATPLPPSESYPGRRYHSGRSIINEIEQLCWKRALETFDISAEIWGVNVQAFSGSLANLYVYTALMQPGETLLHMQLSHGGHLSHGHKTSTKNVSEVAHKFNTVAYLVDQETGIIDYKGLRSLAIQHKPRIITMGGSSYSRQIDYNQMHNIAKEVNALLHCDMAHYSGLVAGGAMESPFPFSDVVTTTTYKSLCGPKGALIFFKKWMQSKIDRTVFPRYQAARDYSVILAISVALRHAQSEEYRFQQSQVVESSRILARSLEKLGYKIVGGGSDSHMVLVDLKTLDINAAEAEKALELVGIVCNQNLIAGDKNGRCTGIRLGTLPMVVRGAHSSVFRTVAALVHEALEITRSLHGELMSAGTPDGNDMQKFNKLDDFVQLAKGKREIRILQSAVLKFISRFPPPWQNF